MNNIKRFGFGVLSSLLLAVGFVRAADHFDPMANSLGASNDHGVASAAPEACTSVCDEVSDRN